MAVEEEGELRWRHGSCGGGESHAAEATSALQFTERRLQIRVFFLISVKVTRNGF